MSLEVIEQIKETFKDLDNFSPDKLQGVIQETLKAFNFIQSKLESKDEKVRQEGFNLAIELKDALESQAAAVCESVGMDADQLSAYVTNAANFSSEEWEVLSQAKQDLKEFQKEVSTDEKATENKAPQKAKKKAKRNQTAWLAG